MTETPEVAAFAPQWLGQSLDAMAIDAGLVLHVLCCAPGGDADGYRKALSDTGEAFVLQAGAAASLPTLVAGLTVLSDRAGIDALAAFARDAGLVRSGRIAAPVGRDLLTALHRAHPHLNVLDAFCDALSAALARPVLCDAVGPAAGTLAGTVHIVLARCM